MKKTFLLSYQMPKFLMLAEWVDYELQTETVWFWGLFKTTKQIQYRVYDWQRTRSFLDHWDNLIKNRLPLK